MRSNPSEPTGENLQVKRKAQAEAKEARNCYTSETDWTPPDPERATAGQSREQQRRDGSNRTSER